MRCTIGITAKRLQLLDAPGLQSIGNGRTHTRMILMQVHTLQLQRLTIQQEASLGVEPNIADARSGFIDVHHPTVHLHRGLYLI